MGNFTHKSLLYLYNELSDEEANSFQIGLYANADAEAEFYRIKEAKDWIDRYLPSMQPSQRNIDAILAFAAKE